MSAGVPLGYDALLQYHKSGRLPCGGNWGKFLKSCYRVMFRAQNMRSTWQQVVGSVAAILSDCPLQRRRFVRAVRTHLKPPDYLIFRQSFCAVAMRLSGAPTKEVGYVAGHAHARQLATCIPPHPALWEDRATLNRKISGSLGYFMRNNVRTYVNNPMIFAMNVNIGYWEASRNTQCLNYLWTAMNTCENERRVRDFRIIDDTLTAMCALYPNEVAEYMYDRGEEKFTTQLKKTHDRAAV